VGDPEDIHGHVVAPGDERDQAGELAALDPGGHRVVQLSWHGTTLPGPSDIFPTIMSCGFLSVAGSRVPGMDQTWRHLPAPARPVAAATAAAVIAARSREREALDDAVRELAALDPAATGLILGTAVRLLLEETHPDGLDGEAVRGVLEHSVRTGLGWQSEVDPHVVLVLLAGALGVTDEDGAPLPEPEVRARHAALLLADLAGPRPIEPVLTAALDEIARVQLND
jgi:hypothetical protein